MAANAESRLQHFLEKFRHLDRQELQIDNPKSPFFPYRREHFDDGLTFADYLKLQRLQESGDCSWEIHDLAVTGFFGLHPDLLPLLEHRRYGPLAIRVISESNPAMLQRCHYFQMRAELNSWYDSSTFQPIDFASREELPEPAFSDGMRIFAWPEHWYLTRMIGHLAFCQNYPPAIADVMSMTGRMGGMVYSNEEAIYLAARASAYEIVSDEAVVMSIEFSRKMGMNLNDIMRLYDDAYRLPIQHLDPVKGFWHGECLGWAQQKKAR